MFGKPFGRCDLTLFLSAFFVATVMHGRTLRGCDCVNAIRVMGKNLHGCASWAATGHVQAATMVIRESVEPLWEEHRPPGITSLKFNKLSLGCVVPKIEGMFQYGLLPYGSVL
ncbi:hypothetical protein IFM89_033941 [Coptis chinensis]|uniref:Secreted protein n=1 Tax=Coptis chinensis TaxID=261450 RepID=A0A835HZQ9_9MAGN|nr:hypothetical protein IFM89_033941 [Coptis chinensis]